MEIDDITSEYLETMCEIVAQVAALQIDDASSEGLLEIVRHVAHTFNISYSETTITENFDGSITVSSVDDSVPDDDDTIH
tara:strand:+ start:623 stop:862 length:240 start_codon:yes stop_codon:yes gene_type:complete